MNSTIKSILSRRSIRAYNGNQIKDEELNLILEAGKYAPSSMNQQPWHFTVIQNKEVLNNINEGCRNIIRHLPNKEYAKRAESENFSVFYNAPTVIVVSGDPKAISPAIDCSLALQNMFLAAESQSINSCWVNAISQFINTESGKTIKEALNIPNDYVAYCCGVFGYSAMGDGKVTPRKENVVTILK